MVELELLRSDRESKIVPVSKFPCVIGRGSRCDIRLDEPGIWVEHAEISLHADNSFRVRKKGEGSLLLKGESVTEAEIFTNDILDLGGIKLRFRLSTVRPSSLAFGDWAFWGAVAFVVIAMTILMILLP